MKVLFSQKMLHKAFNLAKDNDFILTKITHDFWKGKYDLFSLPQYSSIIKRIKLVIPLEEAKSSYLIKTLIIIIAAFNFVLITITVYMQLKIN